MPDEEKENTDDELKEQIDGDFLDALSDVEIEIDELEESEKGKEKEDEGKEGEKDDKKGKDKKESEIDPAVQTLKDEVDKLKRDKNDLKKALHEERQSKKKDKEEGEEKLTDEQILSLLEEHGEDKRVLLNIIKYAAAQSGKSAKKEALNEADLMAKKKQIDEFLVSRYPDIKDDDSDVRRGLEPIKKALLIEDNPFGDYFAMGVQVLNALPDIVKHWYEEGKKSAGNKKADDKRKDLIKDGQLTPKGKGNGGDRENKGTHGLTADQVETANKLGLKTPQQLKIYANQILRSSRPAAKEA